MRPHVELGPFYQSSGRANSKLGGRRKGLGCHVEDRGRNSKLSAGGRAFSPLVRRPARALSRREKKSGCQSHSNPPKQTKKK